MPGRFLADRFDSGRVLRAIVDHSEQAIIAKDQQGVVVAWNDAAERLFGFAADEAIGRSIALIIPADRRAEEAAILQRLRAGEVIRRFETVRCHRDGRRINVELTISPIHGDRRELLGAVKIVRDLTEQQASHAALQAEESRFRTLADNISQLAWMADADGSIFWYNRRWFEYTGTTLDEVQGWGWQRVHHPEHVERVVSRIRQSWDTGEPWEDTFPLRGRDGEYRWFLSRALPIRDADGQIVRWFGTNTDITDQRRLEAALAESNRRKDAFIAALSHELRNPLGAIRTAVAAMESAREDRTVADRSLAIVTRQCAQLSRLLDDLLDASRIAHDRLLLQPEVCDIAVLARATVEAMQPTFSAAGVDLRIALPNDPVKARVDPVRVQQILDNLLGNAAKFTPRGGSVALTLTTDAGSFAIEVADTGIGIATERLDSVFELFVQLADRTDTSGLGIGLSLVRRLAELHGGSATVHSAGLGHGSKFTVRLPRSHDDAAAAIPPPPVAKPTAPRRVLIIEDMADNAAAMVMLLRHHGHRTWVANDSATGIATALRERPDVILLDLGLPDADGYETCRALRAAGLDGLVIAVTGWGQFEDRERTRAAGFDVHLTKPVDPQRILDLIASARRSAP